MAIPTSDYRKICSVQILRKALMRQMRKRPTPAKSSTTISEPAANGRPLNEAKLILVGRGEVGKTCLVNRLIHNQFADTGKTEGIAISEWRVKVARDEVRLNVWDFGGQEIMHATHQFFMTERSLYLLALNGREGGEDADAEYWLKLIESFGGDSPVIVVQNKIDQHPFELNYRGLRAKYPQIRGFVKTDCVTPLGIEPLRQAIVEALGPRCRTCGPASRRPGFAIKDALAGMTENYLSFGRFRALCQDRSERDPKAQDDLAYFLHCLGIAAQLQGRPAAARYERPQTALGHRGDLQNPQRRRAGRKQGRAAPGGFAGDPARAGLSGGKTRIPDGTDAQVPALFRLPGGPPEPPLPGAGTPGERGAGVERGVRTETLPELRVSVRDPAGRDCCRNSSCGRTR